ncbi:[LSU ribosomal protein L11P]-lysine N-methyltransferase [Rhizobium sp. RU20A]|uniref:50S ribosomal protein L11 methyltransferase n=1 Tax=Rhizobium sp. RU20A TaxID=1907412 RepID=UPI00095508DC|nr:50S ribosomal protein L11 methyltransferase [Rhizobium sp. RU20A]SIQ20352.1 [LSU ribosomal protein L11P]-lysine N-methyltransferase [Rhizobium sp. RU20A]
MSELRLYVVTNETDSERVLACMESLFEDDGFAIATMEVDEKKDIWEASVYLDFEDEEFVAARFRELLAESFGHLEITREVVPDLDWIAKSLEGLQPVRAGRFLVHGSHDRDKVKSGDIAIEIDAGQAFGTGHHGTTAGCLEMIEWVLRQRGAVKAGPGRGAIRNALDLGTGSGVLAIAAARMATIPVLATDIDPVATRVARENIRRNRASANVTAVTAAGFHSTEFGAHGPFDLIIANILARPLMRMAPQLESNLAGNGLVILSGILASQRWKVLAAYNGAGLKHVRTLWRNGWVTILLSR